MKGVKKTKTHANNISKSKTGIKHSEEHIAKLYGPRPSMQGENHPFYGRDVPQCTRKLISETQSLDWIIIDPNDNEFKITNLNKFCKDNGLSIACMHRILKGTQKQHKGYKVKRINTRKKR